ncbi:hypothetical protein F511_38588 [Dorcoceras hygrometricum]|uniref:Uncharacterized protein n=1 Tax=Dorcoceras hygrometricum TaxID=472368 RepID=A0A2Z7CQH0_9LAMI|nr:hypothetical protein F511_38588 [Dorcoceras hygrometricum]
MVMEVVHEDMGDGTMQCMNHPYKNSTPGGICAFCLQEKLGNLISSSFSVAICPSSSSSPSPSFRSDIGASRSLTAATAAGLGGGGGSTLQLCSIASSSSADNSASIVFERSKSTTTPRRGMHVLNYPDDYSPHRRGFWSFLYLSKNSASKKSDTNSNKDPNFTPATPSTIGSSSAIRSMEKKKEDFVVVDENDSPSYDRKVSRSRSVGCGSRSFSGDFFERISTGFGDCTLRRVESHREGKPKLPPLHRNCGNNTKNGQDCIKERVKCGGIFSGFMVTSSSSTYLVSSSTDEESNVNGKTAHATRSSMEHISHGRSKSWVWAFASPMRAFVKPSTGKRGDASTKTTTPNLNAIPSLLAVSG